VLILTLRILATIVPLAACCRVWSWLCTYYKELVYLFTVRKLYISLYMYI